MPTTYAHWRFGDRCLKTLPEKLQSLVNNHRDIFNFGVHGPDIFFYYNCLKHNEINKFGTRMHDIPFKDTLNKIQMRFEDIDDKDSALSYMLGFVCHFTLDSYCHGYIDRKAEVSKETDAPTTHGIIESQYDKYLLIKDGYNPFKKKVTDTLKPSKHIGHIIGQIFPELGEDICYHSIKDQKMYLDILKDSNKAKRKLLEKTMDIAHAASFKDLLLTEKSFPEIEDSMMRLDKLFEKAIEHYKELALDVVDLLENNKPLGPYFNNHFCPKEDYKEIPILNVEEEKTYIVERQK